MSAVVLLMGNSMADAVGGIARSYAPAFEKLGHEFIEIFLPDTQRSIEQFNAFPQKDVVLAFAFMSMGTEILVDRPDGKGQGDIWDVLHIPFVSLYGDSPAYFFDRHVLRNPNYTALYGFPEHGEFRKRLPAINGMVGTYPPVAIDAVARDQINFKAKEQGPVIILKNGNDPQKLIDLWKTGFAPKVAAALMELADELKNRVNDPATNQIDDIVLQYFKNRNIDIVALTKLRLLMVAQLDDYLRRVKSKLLVESLLDLPVLLNGYNWDHIDFTGRRLQYVPGGSYVVSRGLIRDSLAMVDMSPNTGGAPHDRPLRAFGSHTLCVTNEQEFFSRNLSHSADFFYRYDPASIQARVADVLKRPQQAVELGAAVADEFMRKFPADAFARHLLDLAPFARFNQLPGLPEGTPNYFAWPPEKL